MKQAALSQFNLTWLPLTALFIFIVCFAVYSYWTFKSSNKQNYEEASNIPLEEAASAFSGKKGTNL